MKRPNIFAENAPTNSPDYMRNGDLNIRTQRATRHDDSIAKTLLHAATKPVTKADAFRNHPGPLGTPSATGFHIPMAPDDRPLIDRLHEATFTDAVGMQWIEDKYALRMILRKAHCFTLDQTTSSLVSDFSIAIAKDLESARRMAIPPFPVTWIELDNRARLARMKALGVGLTHNAATDAVERVGWLIHSDAEGGYFATYVCEVTQGVTLSPLSYWWHSGASKAGELPQEIAERINIAYLDRLSFGLKNSGVHPADAIPNTTPMHIERLRRHRADDPEQERSYPAQVRELMIEIGGELRHIWGFLIALGAGQLGMEASYTAQPKPVTERKMPNGKTLLPLEHKVLHLHMAKRMTVEKVIARSITHHKHRWHEVRSHFRLLKSGVRVPVKAHERGDKRLGVIEKTYRVER
jgi:hypothetical protein